MSTYFITGASRGLGLEIVKQLLENTSNKVIAGSRSQAQELQQLQKKHPERLTLVLINVGNDDSVKAAAAEVAKTFPHIDYLINNAGTGTFKGVDNLTPADFLAELNTNTVGVFRVVKEFLPLIRKSQKKTVIGLSSSLGSIALTSTFQGPFAVYRPSKAALNALFTTLNEEYKQEGISFIPVHPGWVDTDMGSSLGVIPPLKAPESVRGVLQVIHKHKFGDEIKLLNYDGTVLPW